MATNNVFINQLIEQRGTPLPNLDYLGFGEPTTYGTNFLYSAEVVKNLQTKRVKKGTMNRGSNGMSVAPWGESLVPVTGPMTSIYGQDFQKAPPAEEHFNAATLKAKNKALKEKYIQEANVRREQLFEDDKANFDKMAALEREKYNNAQKAFEERRSRTFTHQGTNLRSKLTEAEVFEQKMKEAQEREDRIRQLVPRHTSKTPQPTIAMLKGLNEGTTTAGDIPRAKSAMDNIGHDPNNSEIDTSTASVGIGSQLIQPQQHVYPSDKQRIRFLRLEAARQQDGKQGLSEHGWAPETSPQGLDRKPYHPEDNMEGLDDSSKLRIRVAMEKHKALQAQKREMLNMKKLQEESAFRQQLREMDHLSKQPGIHRNTRKQYAEIMETLLSDPKRAIVVPKNLGIVQPTTEQEIRDKATLVPPGGYKTTVNGVVPLVGNKQVLTGANVDGTGASHDHEGDEDFLLLEGSGVDQTNAAPAGSKTRADRNYNIISNAEGSHATSRGDILPMDANASASQSATNQDGGVNLRPLRRTVHTHMPLPISQRKPHDPTRKDIDRELKTVVFGGHLLKDRSAAIRSLGSERISYIKSLNLSSTNTTGGGGGAANQSAASANNRSYATVSSGGGGARMAKPMVPPASMGKANLSLL